MYCFKCLLFHGLEICSLHSVFYVLCLSVWYAVLCALFLLFLKICSYVNALCNVLNVFCIIHWYFSPSRTVLNAFFTICGYVSFLRTFFNVFCTIVWYVSAPCTVFEVFCTSCPYVSVLCTVLNLLYLVFFFTLASCTLFCMCTV